MSCANYLCKVCKNFLMEIELLRRGKIFYGWFVVLGAFFICMAIMGMHYNLIGLYFPHLAKKYGYSNTELGLYFITSAGITMTITSLMISKIYGKIALRFGMTLAGVLAGFVYIGYSYAHEVWQFMLLTACLGYCVSTGTVSAFSMLSTKWFIKKRGTAISIIASGTGLAGFFFSSYLSNIIETKGFQTAFFHEGIIIISLALLGGLLIRSHPSNLGLEALGAGENEQKANNINNENEINLRSVDLPEALTKFPFYVMAIMLFLMNGLIITFVSQYVSYFRSLNFEPTEIVYIVTGLGISLTLSKLFYGILNDKLGLHYSNFILFVAWFIAIISLIFADVSNIFVVAFTVCSGTLTVITSVGMPLWLGSMYGDKYYPSLIGTVNSVGNVGSMLGPIVVGYFIDILGYKMVFSYGLIMVIILSILLTLALIFAKKNRRISSYKKI